MNVAGWFFCFLLTATAGNIPSAEQKSGKVIHVLTIGNSFADNAVRFLPKIAEASGNAVIIQKANIGGCSMKKHWGFVEEHAGDPSKGKPYLEGTSSLEGLLKSEKWDFVTIQQASEVSFDAGSYHPYALYLRDFVRKHAPTAEVLLHETWPYRVDDKLFSMENGREDGPKTQAEMYQRLKSACDQVAEELGLRLLPSGDAFYSVGAHPVYGFKPGAVAFDSKAAKYPEVPPGQKYSMQKGYWWTKKTLGDGTRKWVVTFDTRHASDAGAYLAGCVWFEVMFGQSVMGNSYVPGTLDAEFALFLRRAAHEAVEKRKEALRTKTAPAEPVSPRSALPQNPTAR